MNRLNLSSIIVFLLSSTVFTAHADTEIEPNSTLAEATTIVVDSETSIDGYLVPNDVDFYKFYGLQGDIVNVDIDNGMGGSASVNTYVAIFDEDGTILRANDDVLNDGSTSLDDGSTSYSDSYIEGFVLPKQGNYTIGVSNYTAPFNDGGTTQSTVLTSSIDLSGGIGLILPQNTVGDYQLNITYTSFKAKQVAIRVSPGNVRYRPINPRSAGIVKVAVLSTADFNVPQMVIPSSLTLGATGDEAQNARCRTKDVNRDTYKDLVCKFDVRAAGLTSLDEEVILKGKTTDGGTIEGSGYIKLVKYHRGHHEKRQDKKHHH